MDCNVFWSAFGAFGQWACATATFFAVFVALKPYIRIIKVELESIVLKMNDETQILPSSICINNKGAIEENIVSIGIRSKDGIFLLSEVQIDIGKRAIKKVPINKEDFWNNLQLIDDIRFRVWVQDSAGYKYYSKRYPTKKYMKSSSILSSFN